MAKFKVQTFNLWFGGARVTDGRTKIADVLRRFPADVVALQETLYELGREATQQLNLFHVQEGFDTALASPFELEIVRTDLDLNATAAWVEVDDSRILMWSVHLHHMDYGPYGALVELPHEQVLSAEFELRRLEQIKLILTKTEEILGASDCPVVIAGDFNSPSSIDWRLRDDRPSVRWPSVDAMHDAGFVDAFREVFPDPVAAPGDSWSQIEPLDLEPRDRIDFIFARGLTPVSARMIGGAPGELADESFVSTGGTNKLIPDHVENDYPSDHMMFEIEFEL